MSYGKVPVNLNLTQGFVATPFTITEEGGSRNGSGYLDGTILTESDVLSGTLSYEKWDKLTTTKQAVFGKNDDGNLQIFFTADKGEQTGSFNSADPGVASIVGDTAKFTFITGK